MTAGANGNGALSSLEQVAAEQNHYVSHLANVNDRQDVISTEDIHNANGLLIVKKGSRISRDVADKILQHKLLKPLEEQVVLEKTIDTNGLGGCFHKLKDKYPDVKQIDEALGFNKTLENILKRNRLDKIIMQKLTVLREEFQAEYEKSIFCAWLSALLASEAGLRSDEVEVAFIAGLCHDIGLLHISPDIVNKRGALTPEEWRAIQSHVVVGQLLLKNIPGADSRAANAILEHHERCDGSGYPVGKTDEHLEMMGQIVGMADSMQAIRVKQFDRLGRNLRDAVPYLHMNANTHFQVVYRTMYSIIRKARLEPSHVNPFGDIRMLVSHLIMRGKSLQGAVWILHDILDLSPRLGNAGLQRKLLKACKPVAVMITSSGLVRDEIFRWLDDMKENPDPGSFDDFADMELMQNELYWQLKKVSRVVSDCLDREGSSLPDGHRACFEEAASELNKVLSTGMA